VKAVARCGHGCEQPVLEAGGGGAATGTADVRMPALVCKRLQLHDAVLLLCLLCATWWLCSVLHGVAASLIPVAIAIPMLGR
jgi:hypothetical protein